MQNPGGKWTSEAHVNGSKPKETAMPEGKRGDGGTENSMQNEDDGDDKSETVTSGTDGQSQASVEATAPTSQPKSSSYTQVSWNSEVLAVCFCFDWTVLPMFWQNQVSGEKRPSSASQSSEPATKKQRSSDSSTDKKEVQSKVANYVEKKMQSDFDSYFEELGIGSKTLRGINNFDTKLEKAHEKLRNVRYRKLEKLVGRVGLLKWLSPRVYDFIFFAAKTTRTILPNRWFFGVIWAAST